MTPLSAPGLSSPPLGAAANAALAATANAAAKGKLVSKAKNAAKDFEAVFLNTMFQQMFSSIGKGPFGGGSAAGCTNSSSTRLTAATRTPPPIPPAKVVSCDSDFRM